MARPAGPMLGMVRGDGVGGRAVTCPECHRLTADPGTGFCPFGGQVTGLRQADRDRIVDRLEARAVAGLQEAVAELVLHYGSVQIEHTTWLLAQRLPPHVEAFWVDRGLTLGTLAPRSPVLDEAARVIGLHHGVSGPDARAITDAYARHWNLQPVQVAQRVAAHLLTLPDLRRCSA